MRQSLASLITILSALVVFAITLEVCARLDDYWRNGAPLWGSYTNEILAVSDEFGRHGKPGAKYEKFELNEFGFNMPPMEREPGPGITRVMLMGASELFGIYESAGAKLSDQLQKMLPDGYQVINSAFFGMSLPRIRQFYQSYLRQFQPRISVVYSNPIFYLDLSPPKEQTTSPARRRPYPGFQPRILGKFKDAAKQFAPKWLQMWLWQFLIQRELTGQPPEYVWTEPPTQRLALFGKHLSLLVQTLRADGQRVILVTHPSRFLCPGDPSQEFWGLAWRRHYPRATIPVLRQTEELANQEIRRLGRELGVEVADLAGNSGWTPDMFADFCHFTDLGAIRAAQIISKAIVHNQVSSCPCVGIALGQKQLP